MARWPIGLLVLLAGCDYVWNLERFPDAQPGAQRDAVTADGAPDATALDGRPVSGITFVQKAYIDHLTTTNVHAAFTNPVVAGDLLVVFVGWSGTGMIAPVTFSDSAGHAYVTAPASSFNLLQQAVFYCPNATAAAAGMTLDATFTTTQQKIDIRALEYRGLAATNVVDFAIGGGNTSQQVSIGNSTAGPNELLVAGAIVGSTVSQPSNGWNNRGITPVTGSIAEDLVAVTQGSYIAGVLQQSTSDYVIHLVAFKSP